MSNTEEQTVQLYSNVTGSKEPGNDSGQGRSKSIQKFYDSVPATNVILATVAGYLALCVHAEPVVLLTSSLLPS